MPYLIDSTPAPTSHPIAKVFAICRKIHSEIRHRQGYNGTINKTGIAVIKKNKIFSQLSKPKLVPNHVKLEPRRLLNADFSFVGGDLDLTEFTDSTAGSEQLTISQTGDVYLFVLSDGLWNGDDSAGNITGDGSNTLLIDNSLGSLVSILATSTEDQFDIAFGDFDFNGDIDITSDGDAPMFGNVRQQAGTTFSQTGTLNIEVEANINLSQSGNDFDNVNIVGANNILLNDANGLQLNSLTAGNFAGITALGDVDLGTVSVGNDFELSTTGDVEVGSVNAVDDIDITSSAGSINDANDDALADLDAGGLVTLSALDEVGGDATAQAVDVDGRLELGRGNIVEATSSSSDVVLGGVGSLTLQEVRSTTGAVDVSATNLRLELLTVDTDLNVTATTGDIRDAGASDIDVEGSAQFNAAAGAITLNQLDVAGPIGLQSLNDATIINTTAVDLSASTVGGDLDVTATTGDVTDNGLIDVEGMGQFNAIDGAINLDQLNVTDSIGLTSLTSATIVNTTAVDLKASDVGTNLNVTATTGDITDSGTVSVGGVAQLNATAGAITADQLDVTGSIGLQSLNDATIINTTAVELSASTVGGDLDVTATTGDVTDNGLIDVEGMGQFNAIDGAINLDQLNVTDSIGLTSLTSATIVNTTAVDLKASDVGTNLNVTATTGDITDSGTVSVGGVAQLNATAGAITASQLDVTGSIGLQSFNDATILNTTAVELSASTVGGDLIVAASTGDITDSGLIDVNGMGRFNARDGSIDLEQLMVTAAIGLTATANATIVNATAIEFERSNVAGDLEATTVTGNIVQNGNMTVGGTTNLSVTVATDIICLTNFGNDFGDEVSASAATVEIVDRNTLVVGDITAIDDIFLRSGAVEAGSITLRGDLTTSVLSGQILIQSNSGATQAATSIITTNELLVGGNLAGEGSGLFDLSGNNAVAAIAANISGELDFVNANALTVSSLSYVSACGKTEVIVGADVADKIRINADGLVINEQVQSTVVFLEGSNGITQTAAGQILSTDLLLSGTGVFDLVNPGNDTDRLAALVDGDFNYFDVDDVTVSSLFCDGDNVCGLNITGDLNLSTDNGNLFQAPDPALPTVNSAAVIVGGNTTIDTGTGDICLTGGDCDGDGLNDNLFTGTLTLVSSGEVVIAEDDNVSIDSLSGGGSYRFIGNNIQINTAISGTQLLLEASDGVDYNGNLIDVDSLMLRGQGLFDFGVTGETINSIDNLAADIDGSLILLNGNAVNIGDLTFISGCGDVDICGVNIDAGGGLMGDLALEIVDADLTQTAAITVEGTTVLNVGTGDICLTGADCTGDGLNDNDLNLLTITTAANAEVVDSNDLNILSATVDNQLWLAAGDQASGQLTLSGNVSAANQILLQASNGVTQTAGILSTAQLFLGGDVANESSGDFTLQSANIVGQLAANLQDDFLFTTTTDLTITGGTLDSLCDDPISNPDTETFTGVNSATGDVKLAVLGNLTINESVSVDAGDLFLNVTGDVTQATAITADGLGLMVTGTTTLTNAANDFNTVAADNEGQILLVDTDDLTVGNITVDGMTITGIATSDDNVKLTTGDDLTINDTINLATGDLFLVIDGNVSQTSNIIADGLGLMVAGTTTLTDPANDVNTFAAVNGGETLFADIDDLSVGTVAVDGMTATGITTSNDNAKLATGGDLAINEAIDLGTGDLFLDVTGNVTQTANAISDVLGLMVTGTTTLNNTDNDFNTVAAENGGEILLVDVDDLAVGTITVDGMSVTGFTTTDDNAKLTTGGSLAINQAVDLGVGDLFLDVTGNVTQTAAIVVDGLAMMVTGTTTLTNAANDANTFAADNGGETLFVDANNLVVGTITVAGMIVAGITTTDDNAKLMTGGDLAINDAISLGSGDLLLAIDRDVSQTANIIADGLGLMVTGTTTLTNPLNDVNTIAADNGGETLFVDVDDLIVSAVTVDGMTVTGITTSDDNAKLTTGGDLAINEAVDVGTGDLFFSVTGDVSQTADVVADGLGMMVTGTTTLANPLNDLNTIAADNGGETLIADVDDLTVDAVSVDGMTVTGITTTDDNAKLTTGGDLAINEAVDVGTGDLFFSVTGDVSQTANIIADGLGLMVSEATTLTDPTNDVNTIAADNDGETLFADVDDLVVGTVAVDGMTITGITTSDDNAKLTTGSDLAINEGINLGTGDLLISVTGDVTQTASITADGLGLMVTGLTTLDNAANDVDTFAADNDGQTLFTDLDDVTVGTVTVDSMTITGITTSDDNVKLTIGDDLAIDEVVSLGDGDLFLAVTGDVSQTESIVADGLGMMVAGTTTLTQLTNDVNILAANNDGETLFVDSDDLTVGSVVVNGMTATGITTSNDNVKLTSSGNLAIDDLVNLGDGNLFLNVIGDVSQSASVVADSLGLMVSETTTLTNPLNDVNIISADNDGQILFVDVDGVAVGTTTVDGMTVMGIMTTDDDVKLTAGDSLSINQAVNLGTGNLLLDTTGSAFQSAAITADGLGLMVAGATTLQDPLNDVNFIAADNGGETLFTDADDLTVGAVVVDGMTVTGITTIDANTRLTSGGDLAIAESVSIGDGDLLLDVTGDVTQTATVVSDGLALMVSGTTALVNPLNDFNRVAADNVGQTLLVDANDLIVGAVGVDGTRIVGLTVDNGGILNDSVSSDLADSLTVLDGTIQTDRRIDGESTFNPAFTGYLNGDSMSGDPIDSVAVGILTRGDLRVNQSIRTNASAGEFSDIYLATDSVGNIVVNSRVTTAGADDKILVVAAEELRLNADLARGVPDPTLGGSTGLVRFATNVNPTTTSGSIPNGVLILDPGPSGVVNTQVDPTTSTQSFTYTFGHAGEQGFTTTVFYGVDLDRYSSVALTPDFATLDSIDATDQRALTNLLFDTSGDFGYQSRSLYTDPSAGGFSNFTQESQPIGGTNDLGMRDVEFGSFRFDFLESNAAFSNVVFVFNDANINIFENSSLRDVDGNGAPDSLTDFNVAVEDFQTLARVGAAPVIEVESAEVDVSQTVAVSQTTEPEFFQTVVTSTEPLFVQTVQEKVFVVVYFENQLDADAFEDELGEEGAGVKDFEALKMELIETGDVEFLSWESDGQTETLDANQIRRILEQAELDLDGDDNDWLEDYKQWLNNQRQSDQPPEIPRGIFKIIEVENGKAVIQGDDVDRRFVPEPDFDGDLQDYPFEVPSADGEAEPDRAPDGGPDADLRNENTLLNSKNLPIESLPDESSRMMRWQAMISGDTEPDVDSQHAEVSRTGKLVSGSAALGVLAMICKRETAREGASGTLTTDELVSLQEIKAQSADRNLFSKASRFKRRNESAIKKQAQADSI